MIGSFEDGRMFPAGTEIETDLCIVEAGASEITIACEFARPAEGLANRLVPFGQGQP